MRRKEYILLTEYKFCFYSFFLLHRCSEKIILNHECNDRKKIIKNKSFINFFKSIILGE